MDDNVRVIVNFAGEGEVLSAININTLEFAKRPARIIVRNGPLIRGDIRRVPLRNDCADEVIGNYVPYLDTDDWAGQVCREAYRILKLGGSVRFNSHTGGGTYWIQWLKQIGFQNVRLQGSHAVGNK